MAVKLYYDLMSQPSRAIYIALKSSKANLDLKYLDLRKGAHYSDEYTKINRFQRVPVIEHNGFTLSESIAIIRYLSRQDIIPESIYPKSDKLQARVDEFLEWHHIGLRLHTSMYTRVVYFNPGITGKQSDEKTIANYKKRLDNALQDMETLWLGQGKAFLTGDTPNFADLIGACEIEQILGDSITGYEVQSPTHQALPLVMKRNPYCSDVRTVQGPKGMAGYNARMSLPNTAKWLDNVRAHYNPFYDEAHATLNKIASKQEMKSAKL